MNLPKISLITPSFNQGSYIEQTILSVIDQNYPNLEYIIIDGGSTDSTINIIKKYEKHISYWISEPDKGQSHAINKGLEKATGEVFNWLNSDDYLEPGSLHIIGKEFSNKQVNVVHGKCRHFKDQTSETVLIGGTAHYNSVEKTICNYSMGQPSHFYRLEKIIELRGLNESLTYAMDMDLWFKYLFKYGTASVKSCSEIISNFRLHESSKTTAFFDQFIFDCNAIIYSFLQELDTPTFIIENFMHPLNRNYFQKWDFSNINKSLLLAYYANKLSDKFYTERDYKNCKKCLDFAKINGYPIDKSFLLRFFKVNYINKHFLNFLRNLKN